MKLDIGAGDRPYDDGSGEWVHLDERNLPHIEYITQAYPLPNKNRTWFPNEFQEIRATHILEHFSYRDTVNVLNNWKEYLVPGGKLYLEVPNFGWQCGQIAEEIDDFHITEQEYIVNLVFGDQDYPGNFHKAAFTKSLLRHNMEQAGLKGVSITDIGQVLIGIGFKP